MADTKSGSRSGSKLNLNESTMPLLDDEGHEKAETPEKDAIEMKEKASTTSEGEKDDSNPEKIVRKKEKRKDRICNKPSTTVVSFPFDRRKERRRTKGT